MKFLWVHLFLLSIHSNSKYPDLCAVSNSLTEGLCMTENLGVMSCHITDTQIQIQDSDLPYSGKTTQMSLLLNRSIPYLTLRKSCEHLMFPPLSRWHFLQGDPLPTSASHSIICQWTRLDVTEVTGLLNNTFKHFSAKGQDLQSCRYSFLEHTTIKTHT